MSERLTFDLASGPLSCIRVAVHDFASSPTADPVTDDDGLAYVFSAPQRVGFWTAGLSNPIDQVFLAKSGRVVQTLEHRAPGDPSLAGPATDVSIVLELAAGAARRHGLLPGVVVPHDLFDPAADPGFIAIVQSDRAGWFLACELRRRGYRIAHVHHTQHLDEVGEDQFDLELIYGDDLDDVLPALTALGPSLVLAGSELGVNPADYLAEALQLPGNGTLRSVARRDKAGMIDALRAAGIPVMRQLRSRSWKRIARWKARRGLAEIVIKPIRSAGTDRVARATTNAEIKVAVRAIVGTTNRLGLAEVEAVAQERLIGSEIYLNSVSRAGHHVVTEIWLETKREAAGAPFAYDTFQLLPGDDLLAAYLSRWLFHVLDALDVTWGPAHTELILTDRGPRLIDFGARLDGVLLPALNVACIGKSPVDITADAYLDPAAFAAFAATPYSLQRHATMVVVDNPAAGVLRDDDGLRSLAHLPTFHALRPRWAVGDDVPATRDAFSYHAIVTLCDPDLAAVRRDHALIREREAAHLLLDVTPRAPERADDIPSVSDPRASAAWGAALAPFGWTTVSDADLVGRTRADHDGVLLWIPRQPHIDLLAVERMRLQTAAQRTIIEVFPDTRIAPFIGAELSATRWDHAHELAFEAIGLTPTMHAQAPALVERATATAMPANATFAPIDMAETVFTSIGADPRWPAALAALPGATLARTPTGAAIGIPHAETMHVPVAAARDEAELQALALALGTLASQVVAPGTNISAQGERFFLPPALRWRRPRWAEHFNDIEEMHDAIGLRADTSTAPLAARFADREHPLATWAGAGLGQALGRVPIWTRTAMLYRAVLGDALHGVVPHARRIDLAAFDAISRKHGMLWVGWEPTPGTSEIVADDAVHVLDWSDPARALHVAAGLGLYPVRARWTHRKTFVRDLATAAPAPTTPSGKVTVTSAANLSPSDWRHITALDAQSSPDDPLRTQMSGTHAARAITLAFDHVAIAIAEGAEGILSYLLCALHDRVAWSMAGATLGPSALGDTAALGTAGEPDVRIAMMAYAYAQGADLMDIHGVWDERYPDEHRRARHHAHTALNETAVYYPPTLARFR